jgi:D-lactate dehydrogenase (cytochrome)
MAVIADRARDASAAANGLEAFIPALRAAVGAEHVLTDAASLELYSVDFSEQRLATAAVVARPGSAADVSAVLRLAREHGVPIVPRGASMSYTLGAVPARPGSLVLDMRRMNRILRIDVEDMNILVEPGVTWAQIRDALADSRYAVPFIGTFSGIRATVGGGLGNWAVGWGKGDITDYLLGIEVVLPDGRIVQTGALAIDAQHPGLTSHGPDFTRVFVHDAGALGVKTKACFRLEPKPGGTAFASWGFRDEEAALAFMTEVARLGVATDTFVFGAYHHAVFSEQPDPGAEQKKAMLKQVVRMSAGPLNAARNLINLARSGRLQFLRNWPCSAHVAVDGINQAGADASMRPVRALARRVGGTPLPCGLGIAMRAQPFFPIDNLIVGREGESCFPSNCTVALSQGMAVKRALDEFFGAQAGYMREHGLTCTRLYIAIRNAFGVEPIIYWKDRMNPLRYSVLNEDRRARYGALPDNPRAREAAIALRRMMVTEVFARFHPVHTQIGKYYPYREALASADCWSMVEGFKRMVDPDRLMNPGALGFD